MFLTVSQKYFSYVGKGCVTNMRKAQGIGVGKCIFSKKFSPNKLILKVMRNRVMYFDYLPYGCHLNVENIIN